MSKGRVITGLDVGSHAVKIVMVQKTTEGVEVLGSAQVYSEGIRRGIVIDIEGVVKSIKDAVGLISQSVGIRLQKVNLGVNGTHLSLRLTRGVVAVALADGEITADDIIRVMNAAKTISLPPNREILQVVPREFVIDGEGSIREPLGMHGVRLEVNAFIMDGSSSFIKNLKKSVEATGLTIQNLIISSLAATRAALSKRQKELGVVLVDIGAGTTNVIIFEEGDLAHTQVIPIGSDAITNDLALRLKTSVDIAERIKLDYGICLPKEVARKDMVDLATLGEEGKGLFTRKEIARIIESRCKEIFDTIQKELKKIGKAGLLPGGAVLIGGGVKIPGMVELAKEILKLPIQIGFPQEFSGQVDKIDDPALITAAGLALWGVDAEAGSTVFENNFANKIKKLFRIFIP